MNRTNRMANYMLFAIVAQLVAINILLVSDLLGFRLVFPSEPDTPMKAIVAGHSDLLQLMLKEGISTEDREPIEVKLGKRIYTLEGTAIVAAAASGNVSAARMLHEEGRSLRARDTQLALCIASAKGHSSIVEILMPVEVKDGREISCQPLGDSPTYLATKFHHDGVLKILQRGKTG
jgi:Ankyrin repeats (3 copies)